MKEQLEVFKSSSGSYLASNHDTEADKTKRRYDLSESEIRFWVEGGLGGSVNGSKLEEEQKRV